MALVQSQQLTGAKTPHKQRGFLLLTAICANFVLPFFAVWAHLQSLRSSFATRQTASTRAMNFVAAASAGSIFAGLSTGNSTGRKPGRARGKERSKPNA